MECISIIIAALSLLISIAAFVFSIMKFRTQKKVAFNIKCTYNAEYKQTCVITNETINSAENVRITSLNEAYTLTDNKEKSILIEHFAPQTDYKFSLNRESVILDTEFTDVNVSVEWQDGYKKDNRQIIIIQVPEQNGV